MPWSGGDFTYGALSGENVLVNGPDLLIQLPNHDTRASPDGAAAVPIRPFPLVDDLGVLEPEGVDNERSPAYEGRKYLSVPHAAGTPW